MIFLFFGSKSSVLRKRILAPGLCALLLLHLVSIGYAKTQVTPHAGNGVIDLKEWDWTLGRTVGLDGQWEFYWKQLLDPKDFKEASPSIPHSLMTVTGTWDQISLEGKPLPKQGFATFRLKLQLPVSDRFFALHLRNVRSSYRLFVDQELLIENGKVGRSALETIPSYYPRTLIFQPQAQVVTLLLQVSNYTAYVGGLRDSIRFGPGDNILAARRNMLSLELFLVGCNLIIGLYHFFLFFLRRKERSSFYFGSLCLLVCIRTLMVGERFVYTIFPNLSWDVLIIGSVSILYLMVATSLRFIALIFPAQSHPGIVNGFTYICLIGAGILAILPVSASISTIFVIEIIVVIAVLYHLFILAKAIRKKQSGSVIFLSGILVFFGFIINDILYQEQIVQTGFITPIGIVAYIFAQALVLSIRFTGSMEQVEIMAEEISEKNTALQLADKQKDNFLASVSHELRTPLQGMIGLSETMLEKNHLHESDKETLHLQIQSGQRLGNLVNNILDLSKIEVHDLIVEKRSVDLKKVNEIVMANCRGLLDERNQQLIDEIPNGLPLILADEDRLQQILFNLIGNAIKFTPNGKISVSAEAIYKKGDIQGIQISVKDAGIGISNEDLENILRPYQQGNRAISDHIGGTGIGLTITSKLIDLMGGKLMIESQVGQGSRFYFTLPIAVRSDFEADNIDAVANPVESVTPAPVENVPGNRMAQGNRSQISSHPLARQESALNVADPEENSKQPQILIVDDEAINLRVLEAHLTSQNYRVLLAQSGSEALYILEEEQPDLILLDLLMPRMNGYEVCNIIRQNDDMQSLPIIMITALNQQIDIIKGLEWGANDYLVKPVTKQILLARVQNQLKICENQALKAEVEWRQEAEAHLRSSVSQLEYQIDDLKGIKPANHIKLDYRETLVEIMSFAMDLWEQDLGKSKYDLAEESNQWKVQRDSDSLRTRTLDKYFKLSTLPTRARSKNVKATANFVLNHCSKSHTLHPKLQSALTRLNDLEKKL